MNLRIFSQLRMSKDHQSVTNLIIDPDGKIHFFSLLDTKGFDAKFFTLTARLDELILKHKPN